MAPRAKRMVVLIWYPRLRLTALALPFSRTHDSGPPAWALHYRLCPSPSLAASDSPQAPSLGASAPPYGARTVGWSTEQVFADRLDGDECACSASIPASPVAGSVLSTVSLA